MNQHETNISGLQGPQTQEVRLPRSNEDGRRSESDPKTQTSRSQGTRSLKSDSESIRRKKPHVLQKWEFRRLAREGKRVSGDWISINYKKSFSTKLGITVSCKYGSSPERNRFKRIIREIFRLHYQEFKSHFAINVIPKKTAKTAHFTQIQEDFLKLIHL
jgi:ribonuclease P protein component